MDNSRVDKEMTLEETVNKVRIDFETKAVPTKILETLYLIYNPLVGDIRTFVLTALEQFPRLYCGLASVYLAEKLSQGEVIQGKYGDHDHTFIHLGNDMIIDITADQYGGPKIYIGPLQSPWAIKP